MFFIGGVAAVALIVLTVFLAICFRVVVPTNMVHIVQRSKNTTPYGQGKEAGNIYYKWPAWIPLLGVYVTTLPESVFPIALNAYDAYDQGRLPFMVDVRAFFRIEDSQKAAQRVSNFADLQEQLLNVLQGAVRRVLATSHLENIMQDRATLGKLFTDEVDEQLKEWGVCNVKAIEFMDIRDSKDSTVIHDIMAKEKSRISQESRVAVANNEQIAQLAEINSRQVADVRRQEAEQLVGLRTAEKNKEVGIATEKAKQETEGQAKVTAERTMEVQRVRQVKQAEIDKDTAVIKADAGAQATVKEAEGALQASLKSAEGVAATGRAQGEAETARLMAPVNSQIALAEKIGSDQGYQNYLVTIRGVEAQEAVGKEMALALRTADLKIIANSGDVASGVSSLGSVLSPAGGTNLSGFLTALGNTEEGKQVIDAVTNKLSSTDKKSK
jgi:flotillin